MYKFLLIVICLCFSFKLHAKVVHQERSMYRNIIVEDDYALRCLRFNVKTSKTNQSCMFKNDPQKLVFNYTKLLFSSLLVMNKAPQNILIIGLGGGTMSNALHQIYPSARIENVEIDPAVIKVARDYFGFFENDIVTSKVQDGRIFIKRAALKKQQFDWIILDAFNGDYIPEHLLTREFLDEAKQILSERGVLSSNTFSTSDLYAHESATYLDVFGDYFNITHENKGNRIILTTNFGLPDEADISARAKSLYSKLKPYGVDTVELTTFFSSTKDEKDWPSDTKILTDQYSPANLLKN